MQILYVEDDPTTRQFVEKGLRRHGFDVDVAATGQEGLHLALGRAYDAVILDVALPDVEGFDVLARLRRAEIHSPVLFLSARGEAGDRIRGLNLGADDYLPKPFAFAELVARLRAVARRHLNEPDDGVLRVVDLILDTRRREVRRGEARIELSPKQFSLLEYLMRNASYVVSRDMIIEKVWGYGFASRSNAIDVHINVLRRKVDRDFQPKLIHTVRGIGYVLDERPANGRSPDA